MESSKNGKKEEMSLSRFWKYGTGIFFAFLSSQGIQVWSQTGSGLQPMNRILIIYDASNSMNARWQGASKMSISKKLVADIIDSLATVENVQLALRVYGHQSQYPPLDCGDSRLEVPFAAGNGKKIAQVIRTLQSKGATPIAYSLREAAKDFPPCTHCRNLIILITDGIEECGEDPCEASAFLQEKGIALRPFIIGIGEDFSHDFGCVGEYFDASDEEEFVEAFEAVITQALNSTTAQVHLLDADGAPTVSNVNMTFYDHVSGKVVYNYVHALDYAGYPDTLSLDPMHVYDLVVHTRPALRLDSLVVRAGRHSQFALPAAQGDLLVRMKGARPPVALHTPCLLREPGKTDIVNVQYVNDKERYLCGKYDLEILTLPPLCLENVSIEPDKTTMVEVPLLGILVFRRSVEGYGSLYEVDSAGREVLVYRFDDAKRSETLYLRPGTYRVVNRSRYNQRSSATREKTFVLNPGATVEVAF